MPPERPTASAFFQHLVEVRAGRQHRGSGARDHCGHHCDQKGETECVRVQPAVGLSAISVGGSSSMSDWPIHNTRITPKRAAAAANTRVSVSKCRATRVAWAPKANRMLNSF